MLPHLCRRFHASSVTILRRYHCNSVRLTCHSTVRLLPADTSAQRFLPSTVLRLECSVCFKTRATSHIEEKFRRRDRLSSDYDLIYRAPLLNYVRIAQGVCIGLTMLYSAIFINECIAGTSFSEFKDIHFGLTLDNIDKLLFVTSFCIVNVFLYFFISRYTLRIYSCKDGTYKSIFLGTFPWNTSKLSFKKGEILAKPSLYFLPWKDSQFRIGRKTVIILDEYFRTPADFHAMFKA